MHAARKGRLLTRCLISAGIAVAVGRSADIEAHRYVRGYVGWNTDQGVRV